MLRITHVPSGTILAEGPRGWGITSFEGNFYVRRKYLNRQCFRFNFVPGICIYKFLYVWMNLVIPGHHSRRFFAWMYVLPNPVLPFIWFRVELPAHHPELEVQELAPGAALVPKGASTPSMRP